MPANPISASTVVLLRNRSSSLEVYLVQKSRSLEFAGGAFVFPGGTVDETDRNIEWLSFSPGLSSLAIQETFPDVSLEDAVGFYVAAVRELFEEAGILLVQNQLSSLQKEEMRRSLLNGKNFLEMARKTNLVLKLEQLTYFSHWITPEVYPVRFGARFFLAELQSEAEPSPDGYETLHGLWISPSLAMQENSKGNLPLMFPTLTTLQELSHFSLAKDAVAWGERRTKIPRRPWVDETGDIHLS